MSSRDNGLWICDLADRSYPVRSAVLAAYSGCVNDVTAAVCSNPASVITPEEWEQYFPGTSLSEACPHQS